MVICRFIKNSFDDLHELSGDLTVHQRQCSHQASAFGFISGRILFKVVEENFENWEILRLQKITHKSFGNLISDIVKFLGNGLVDKLGKQVKTAYSAENALVFGQDGLIQLLIAIIFIGCFQIFSLSLLDGLISLLEKLINQKLLNLVVDQDLDGFIIINAILDFQHEMLHKITEDF